MRLLGLSSSELEIRSNNKSLKSTERPASLELIG